MKKKLKKGQKRCAGCNEIYLIKDLCEHIKTEEHLRKSEKIKKEYEDSLEALTNYKG